MVSGFSVLHCRPEPHAFPRLCIPRCLGAPSSREEARSARRIRLASPSPQLEPKLVVRRRFRRKPTLLGPSLPSAWLAYVRLDREPINPFQFIVPLLSRQRVDVEQCDQLESPRADVPACRLNRARSCCVEDRSSMRLYPDTAPSRDITITWATAPFWLATHACARARAHPLPSPRKNEISLSLDLARSHERSLGNVDDSRRVRSSRPFGPSFEIEAGSNDRLPFLGK